METHYFVALAIVAAPVLQGKVSLSRSLRVTVILGIALIALSSAQSLIAGAMASRRMETQVATKTEIVSDCRDESHMTTAAALAIDKVAHDLSVSGYMVPSETPHSTQEPNALIVVTTVDPAMVSCPAKGLA